MARVTLFGFRLEFMQVRFVIGGRVVVQQAFGMDEIPPAIYSLRSVIEWFAFSNTCVLVERFVNSCPTINLQ